MGFLRFLWARGVGHSDTVFGSMLLLPCTERRGRQYIRAVLSDSASDRESKRDAKAGNREIDLVEYLIGVALAAAVAGLATVVGFDRDRSFGPTILIVVASYYVLFAVMGGSGLTVLEILVAVDSLSSEGHPQAGGLAGRSTTSLSRRSMDGDIGLQRVET